MLRVCKATRERQDGRGVKTSREEVGIDSLRLCLRLWGHTLPSVNGAPGPAR